MSKNNTQLTKIIITGLTKVSREEEGFPSQSKALLKMAKAKKFHDLLTGEDLILEGLQLPKLCERDIKQINIDVAKERAGSKLPDIKVGSGGKPFKNSQLGSIDPLQLPPIRR